MPFADERVRRLVFDAVAVDGLRRVLEVGREAGVVLAPVKGVVLARWLYASVDERPYRDLDLVVSPRDLPRMIAAVKARGWVVRHVSVEMGELEFEVGKLVVEIHAEFGRRDLTRLTIDDVLARASVDRGTFPFEVLRIDEADHFLLLVANVTKKSYTYANRHQPADLERLLLRLEPRWGDLVERARAASFTTALRSVAGWMAEEHGSSAFARFVAALPRAAPRVLPSIVRLQRRLDRRRGVRLRSASGLIGLALVTLTPDDWTLRGRGLARIVRRGLARRRGRDPG
jgi:putative nucleotidyltransferase-like protein